MSRAANEENRFGIPWVDVLWVFFLVGLAFLQPVAEIHKQLTLAAIGIFQLSERYMIARLPKRGPFYAVFIKILLATILMQHTSPLAIDSSYYPIYFLPVVTAAIYFGPWTALLWTALTSVAYCSLIFPALAEYELTAEGLSELGIRVLFFFLAGILVNRFVTESKRQAQRQQALSDTLAETNRRLAQAEADVRRTERVAALGQLSAGLAHEIRNPLGVIKGSAEMLQQKLENPSPLASELAGNISSEVNRLSALVARFLDFARPQQLDLRVQPIAPLVDRALKAAQDQYPDAKVTVERNYAAGLPELPLDERFCEQVFVNLALNAYEAMAPGGGALRVSIATAERGGSRGVEVTVRDTGPGIAAEMREQIFNPFVTTKRTGVGLGLSIVSKIVDEHGGAIRVTNELQQGACFRVFFALEPRVAQAAAKGAG
jgi:two-component system, NtrC family, sensor histidine kinase HydH